ncbi:MAG: hypothetical protein KME49_08210 [Brasilonema octagenarum HA4186-MV1]|jgi:hypothetical protein|nr:MULTISPECIES: hypothetical protein [Brasilonema]MBW4625473.1 hypothetical protein [Brasilonema octagenarum HA4186-MV1]
MITSVETLHVSPALREGFPQQATGVREASPKEIPEGQRLYTCEIKNNP